MTHLAELEPRRRRHWLIAAPLAIVVALGVAWTALWFYAAGEAEKRLNDWQEQQAQGGRVFTCASRSVGGYPFRIEVTCAGVAAELKDAQPPIAIKLKQILAVAQGVIGEPRLLILDEPSGGLAPIVIDRILEVASRLCADGLAILLVEQLVEKALRHANHGYLIETGRVAASAAAQALREGDLIERVYLGHGAHRPA